MDPQRPTGRRPSASADASRRSTPKTARARIELALRLGREFAELQRRFRKERVNRERAASPAR